MSALVGKPVALFGREVATPVGDFDVAFQEGGVHEGFCKFIPDVGFFFGAGRCVGKGAVGEGGALAVGLSGEGGDVNAGKFQFCFLIGGEVGGGREQGEGVDKVLLIFLIDEGGEGGEGGEQVVDY